MKKKKAPARAKPAPKKAAAKPAKKAPKSAARPVVKPVLKPVPMSAPEPIKKATLTLRPAPESKLIERGPRHAELPTAPVTPASVPAPTPAKAQTKLSKTESSDANIARLRRAKGFVLDLDGTLVLGDARNHGISALPNALEFIAYLRSKKIPFIALTNGTIRTPYDIAQQLKAAQFDISHYEVLTPAAVAASYFTAHDIHRVMVLGVEGSSQPLQQADLALVPPKKGERADAVFVGWFRSVTMDHIEAACGAVERGAKLFTASMAAYFATAEGKTLGTSCAIIGAIGAVTGAQATVLGKPSHEALNLAAERMKVDVRDIAVIGDDVDLEIPMAHAAGALAVGVTTGTSKSDDFANAKGEHAHIVVPGIGDVLRLMQGK